MTLDTGGAEVIAFDPDWRTRLLAVIARPSIALVLMMLGIYGLLFEFYQARASSLPGVVGGISLLLALFAFQMLPVSYTGLALIVLGIGIAGGGGFRADVGVLGIGGVLAFVIGSVMLIDPTSPGYGFRGR